MDWLKDKKNQPIIALAAAAVIVAVLVVMYFTVFKSDSSSTDAGMGTPTTTDPAMGTPAPTDPNAMAQPGASTDPNAAAGAAQPAAAGGTTAGAPAGATVQASSAVPTETWRNDPFLPIGYKPPKKNTGPKPTPKIWDLPIPAPIFGGYTFSFKAKNLAKPVYESPQPARRMAGLMLNGKVYAIIETNGASEVVQPGDTLRDGLATVEKIERDKIILKTTDEKPRYLVVNMAANRQAAANLGGGNSGGGMPGPGGLPMPAPGLPRP